VSRRVAVFSLGGTIAMTSDPHTPGVIPALSGQQLLAAVPGLSGLDLDVEVHDFRRVPGGSLAIDDVIALHASIGSVSADGVVVTQGTDTIEEVAYLLDLLESGDQPVVVTGAMRNPTLAGADGPSNLLAAIQVAGDATAAGLGCLVVFADEIHAARHVRKIHGTSVAAFASPDAGPLGYLVEGRVRWLTIPRRRPAVQLTPGVRVPRVPLVTATMGDDGELLRCVDDRFDGLVVAAFGAGHVPAAWVEPLATLAKRIPVVLASHPGGPLLTTTYMFPGSEIDLLRRGLIGAGFLNPAKARILLILLLMSGAERHEIARTFTAEGD